jgi:hypothetical protein
MRVKTISEESNSPEPTLHEELAALGEDDSMDFMNLTAEDTGIEGIVFISTVLGRHGPRVTYFLKTGRNQPSFSVSIASDPRVLASSLPRPIVAEAAPSVIRWVKLNRGALMNFWQNGTDWTRQEVEEFARALKKLPRD